ncbi:MAG: hypothetical protein H7Y08_09605 [Rhizobiaceae bacterium]|nr:hypothetical protein [Rhizobiaceae bacterium]
MREHVINPTTGVLITDWIRWWHLSIEDVHAGLDTPISAARRYGLDAEETLEFIRRSLRALLDQGAIPVVLPGTGRYRYVRTNRYGTRRDEIVEGVIAEWQTRGDRPMAWGDYAFTMPENLTILR